MEKSLQEQVSAMKAFQTFCADNELSWQDVIAFATALAALGLKINKIDATEAEQEENNKGVTRTKSQRKQDMANDAVAVAQAAQSYARSIGDFDLYDELGKSYTGIVKGKDNEAIASATTIFNKVKALPTVEMVKYGISAVVLELFEQSITNFSSAQPTTRNVKTRKTVLTNNCLTLVNEGNDIMRKDLLKIGRQFKKTDPDFYAGLVQNAKVINNHTHSKIRLTVIDSSSGELLTGALIEIEGTSLSGLTDMKGKCTVSLVPAGKRNVTIKKTGYDVMTIAAVDFKRGKSITRVVKMIPQHVTAPADAVVS